MKNPIIKFIIATLCLLSLYGSICFATTPEEIETEIANLRKELIKANEMIMIYRNEPDYHNQSLEEKKKDNLVFWSQRTVMIRNKMENLRAQLNELREIEFYNSNQPQQP